MILIRSLKKNFKVSMYVVLKMLCYCESKDERRQEQGTRETRKRNGRSSDDDGYTKKRHTQTKIIHNNKNNDKTEKTLSLYTSNLLHAHIQTIQRTYECALNVHG